MASIPGSHYDIFAPGQTVNIAVTPDPNSVPPPVPGGFNLEVITNATGIDKLTPATGYQGLAILSANGQVLSALHGNYGVVDNGGNDLIILGDGRDTVRGAYGDTLVGGTGLNQFIDAHLGNQSVLGGCGVNETIWGGPGDTIVAGGALNQFIDAHLGNQSVLGGCGGNDTIWGALTDTITGSGAGNETIAGVSGETILGGAANTFFDATAGSESIVAGTGNTTIWGGAHDTIQGALKGGSALIGFAGGNETFWDDGMMGRHDSISTFTQSAGDRISLNSAADTPRAVLASTTSDNSGNVVVHLHDGSSVTLIGISQAQLSAGYFITH